MLDKKVTKKLNEQINLEFYSSNLYLQMSAWCSQQGFEGAAKFLRTHADEEMQHMQKLFQYLNDTGIMPVLGELKAPKAEYTSLKEIFELTLEHEKLITEKINKLVEVTFECGDQSSFNFLQWYVAEQHEEEKLFNSILDKFNLLGDSGLSLYFVDKELAAL